MKSTDDHSQEILAACSKDEELPSGVFAKAILWKFL
jgi:hypothetical protein